MDDLNLYLFTSFIAFITTMIYLSISEILEIVKKIYIHIDTINNHNIQV